jgi:hypothetical protein
MKKEMEDVKKMIRNENEDWKKKMVDMMISVFVERLETLRRNGSRIHSNLGA